MSNRICGRCKSSVVVPWNNVKDFYMCMNCSAMGYAEKFPEKTVFDRITTSPEVLAEEIVEIMYNHILGDSQYFSMLTYQWYTTREAAIAATVAKLKEVAE